MKRSKKILWAILLLCLAYLGWLAVGIVSYRQYKSPPSQDAVIELQGIYHLHTKHSDGTKSTNQIARIAAKASLDFLIFTDHGNPNAASMSDVGWKEGVLVLAGSEISSSRGHLVALDFNPSNIQLAQQAEESAFQVHQLGGFTIIAHPYSKTNWTWGKHAGYSGMEVINADSLLKTRIQRWIPYLPSLLIRPRYLWIKILKYPERNILKWDDLNRTHQVFGYYSTDAHLFYRSIMSFLKVHLLLDEPLSPEFDKAEDQVYGALRTGRFYSAIDAAAQADGFRFWASAGQRRIPMGGSLPLDESAALHAYFPTSLNKEIRLLRDGKSIFIMADDTLEFDVEAPGTYRVEVYLKERTPLNERVPWILSNPIFVKETGR